MFYNNNVKQIYKRNALCSTKSIFDIENFEFWGNARNVVKHCIRENKFEDLEILIEDVFCDSEPSDIEINDFVSFETEDLILDTLNKGKFL